MNQSDTRTVCNLTEADLAAYVAYENITWWMENVAQSIVGIAGIISNTIAIPVLCSKRLYGIFNRLLIFLAIFDNVFIMCQILEAKRKLTNNFEGYFEFDQLHELVFGYFLYPLHAFVLTASIYITVALALERYRAVWRPVEYHNKYKGVNPWKRIMKSYISPVIAFSMAFSIPKWFEIEFATENMTTNVMMMNISKDLIENETLARNYSRYHGTYVSETNLSFAKPTEFRLNDIYVLLYTNIARILVQGIIPFICLSFLNYRIYWVIKRRRQLKDRPRLGSTDVIEEHIPIRKRLNSSIVLKPNSSSISNGGDHLLHVDEYPSTFSTSSRASFSAERKANEAKHAVILFIIVLLFFICHTPRVIINIHEFLYLDLFKRGMESECDKYPILVFIFTSVSNCLLTINSSSNFYIYCFMCSTFRSVLFDCILDVRNFLKSFQCSCATFCCQENNTENSIVVYNKNGKEKLEKEKDQSIVQTKSITAQSSNEEIPKIVLHDPDIIQTTGETL